MNSVTPTETEPRSSRRVHIFRPHYERFYLGLMAFGLLFCTASLVTGFGKESLGIDRIGVLVFFIGFNYQHLILTFVGLAVLPEMRKWLRHQFSMPRFFFFGSVVAVILYIGAVRFSNIDRTEISGQILISIYVGLIAIHTLSQTKGLSLLYNRLLKPNLTPLESEKARRVEILERICFNGMLVIFFLYWIVKILKPELMGEGSSQYFAIAIGSLSIVIVLNSARYPAVFRSNKVYFLFGALLYGLVPILPVANVVNRALHGCEYVFLADRMMANSKVKWQRATLLLATVPLFLSAILFSLNVRYNPSVVQLIPRNWIGPIVSIGLWFEYLHYYLDAVMFRFSDPVVRANIGPLLIPIER